MSDRVEYIRRRLDQLEAAAKAADVKQGDPEWKTNQVMAAWPRTYRVRSVEDARPIATVSDVSGDYEADATEILDGKAVAEHIALNDPAAVLARVAADRKLLAEHKAWDFNEDGYEVCGRCMEHRRRGKGWKFMPAPCPTIRLMAEGLGWTGGGDE